MSTKTTFKRVALVAVASLGFGVLTSVAPASAVADATITSLTAGTPSPVRVGVASMVTITAAHAADASVTNTFKVAAKVATAPSTSKAKSDTNTASVGVTIVTGSGTGESLSQANAYVTGGANAVVSSTSTTATSSTFKVSFRADVEGTYTVLVSAGNTAYTAGDKTVVVTFTTVGAPTALTVASLGGSVVTGGKTNGQLFGLTMKDANGNATVLGQDESIVLADSEATTSLKGATGSGLLSAFGAGSDGGTGTYIFRVVEEASSTVAKGTAVITLTGSGLLPSSLVTNTTATLVTAVAYPSAVIASSVTCKAASTNCVTGSGSVEFSVNGAAALTVANFTAVTAATNYLVTVTTAAATPLVYDTVITLAAAATGATAITTASFTAPAPTTTIQSKITLGLTPFDVDLAYGKPVAKAIATTNTKTVLSALAGTSTLVRRLQTNTVMQLQMKL